MFEGLFQPTHLIVILIIVLVVFGPGKLGDIGGQLGRGIREFKKSMQDIDKPEVSAETMKTDSEKIEGSGKLSDIGGQLGRGLREFKKSLQEIDKPDIPAEAKKPDSEKIVG